MPKAKAAIILLAGTDTHADLGRATNALETVRQFQDVGDEVKLIFDGAGTAWVPRMTDEENPLHPAYQAIEESVHGACQFCANAFDVRAEIEASSVPVLAEANRHPDIRSLVSDGYEVITF